MNLKRKYVEKLSYLFKNTSNIQTSILDWYDCNGRNNLPWKNSSIYEIWISEIMLQQTQVKTVIPYFLNFIKKFPTLESLINAEEDDIIANWSGLGYYRRARNIYASCKLIKNKYNGEFPKTIDEIIKLPGIGRTTASAIATFSKNGKHTILDANVKRLLKRIYNLPNSNYKDDEKTLWELSENLLSEKRPDDFIQAYMDLGSLICKPRNPNCSNCPVSLECLSKDDHKALMKRDGKLSSRKSPKEMKIWVLAIRDLRDNFYLEKISMGNLWSGLYSSPIFGSESKLNKWIEDNQFNNFVSDNCWTFEHRLTHKKITFFVYSCVLDKNKKVSLIQDNWYNLSNITIGIPRYQTKINEIFEQAI